MVVAAAYVDARDRAARRQRAGHAGCCAAATAAVAVRRRLRRARPGRGGGRALSPQRERRHSPSRSPLGAVARLAGGQRGGRRWSAYEVVLVTTAAAPAGRPRARPLVAGRRDRSRRRARRAVGAGDAARAARARARRSDRCSSATDSAIATYVDEAGAAASASRTGRRARGHAGRRATASASPYWSTTAPCSRTRRSSRRSRPRRGMAVTNVRLQAEVVARAEQLAASRRRIVEAADAQRRRLQQRAHDGAERRLAAVAAEHVDGTGDRCRRGAAPASSLGSVEDQLAPRARRSSVSLPAASGRRR